ncbi:DUF2306 domain-containing protein [Pandoraea fibrosis]|uniref:DUF2306 domain-containing protein n=1 Tax=Pandoraea fibrosis TaxID=1891094 RepID=A0A5E4XAV0_9BURK|nr:DUF2306 domain-containing protein [Pandoraea fibrosis]VVE33383.1 hypothetical protein PFI31113_03729 [Pandoraea fibrosis]
MATIVGMHLAAAVAAVLLGAGILFMRRGTSRHRWFGRLWVTAMAATAATSFGIRELDAGHLSWLHALSAYVLVSLVLAVVAIRRGHVSAHRRQMLGLYTGLVIAGAAAVWLPGRVLNSTLAQMWHHEAVVAPGDTSAGLAAPGRVVPVSREDGRRHDRDRQVGAPKSMQSAPPAESGSLAMTGGAGA